MLSQVDAGRWDHVAGVLPWTDREWYRAGVRYGASYGRAASDGIHGSCYFLETLRFFIKRIRSLLFLSTFSVLPFLLTQKLQRRRTTLGPLTKLV